MWQEQAGNSAKGDYETQEESPRVRWEMVDGHFRIWSPNFTSSSSQFLALGTLVHLGLGK